MEIVIKFENDSTTDFTVSIEDGKLNPYILLMLGSYFEFEGKYALTKVRAAEEEAYMKQMAQQQQIAQVKPEILRPT